MSEQKGCIIGLFGIGLEAYWSQFSGLHGRLEGYLQEVEARLITNNATVINAGLVDTIDKAFSAGSLFRRSEVDIIFLHVTTYALSSMVLPVIQKTKVPVVVLNLAPGVKLHYESINTWPDRGSRTAEWLAYCAACAVPEMANVFRRTGISFHEVTGMLYDDQGVWGEIGEWVAAAQVGKVMSNNRLGCMGHYYSGMLDVYTDLTRHYAQFGGHIELIEVDELADLRKQVTSQERIDRCKVFHDIFEVQPGCKTEELDKAAITSVALDQLVERYALGSMAYYYKGSRNADNEETMNSIILGNSILTARGIPVAGEYEVKNAQAMKILDSFGAGGSFTEYYAMDYADDIVLMGHDGPGHMAIAEGKIKVCPLTVYHGKPGHGLSVEMRVKHGPVTLLSVVEGNEDGLFLLFAHAESVPGPILHIGNTNSRYKFQAGAKAFVRRWNAHGPAHHCAVGLGHIGSKIKKLGWLLHMNVIEV